MNNDSRIKNSTRNAIVGIAGQVFIVFINFFSRSIFIKFLSEDYLGVNGLFSNILTILSLADLGLGDAIIYSMYKAIAEKDKKKIKALMNLYSSAYKVIGLFIAITGVAIVPLLKYIIRDSSGIENLNIIYLMFLTNTVVSYFYAYKRSIISADQREYINSKYKYTFMFLRSIAQVIILYLTKNYLLYLAIQIIFTILENVFISIKIDRLYPFIKRGNKEKLDDYEKNSIFSNIKALIIYKISSALLDGTDNIIVSSLISVKTVGVLSNYNLIIGSVSMVVCQISSALTASIGNVVNTEKKDKQIEIFYLILFIHFIIYSFTSVCLLMLLNPFITLWIGKNFLFNSSIVVVLVLNYYIYGMQSVVWTYRSTMGLFIYGKFRPVASAIINIIVSIILAKYIGVLGVLLGTTITRVVTNIWYDPLIIFKHGFKTSIISYYKVYIRYFINLIIMIIINGILFKILPVSEGFLSFLLKSLICSIVIIVLIFLMNYKTKEFKYLLNIFNNIILKIKKR
ncbi:sugar translocase [Clostridium perfringens]|uniref:lipopolysaccharide biosynthesis protein n=2 Tax=Clostridium perfringens TaxID=1502 RepID=UPI000E140E1E|nr:sugar translocase [Clostridium perfringens]MDM0500697.1 sugar translocase [Clostridium perfringens]MDM0703837.1 sugar translocase [Clostridium perfringens]SUY38089.1 membrane protein involved in the export of O-antigen and teichoic acid [Clostridium perfringens]